MNPTDKNPFAQIERAFVRLDEGQLHLRRLPAAEPGHTPLLLFHASPASSWFLQDFMLALRAAGRLGEIVAPDTLGNGDSPPPAPAEPDIAYFADSMDRLCDALGFKEVDAYGTHTGARIACELAAGHEGRVRRLVLDGITEYEDELRDAVIANYAPTVEPDEYGRHLIWAFNFCRDQALFFPHFMKDAEHRLAVPMPPAQVLHRVTLDVLKALDTYPKPYIAAFRYRAFERMPRIAAPTLLLKPETELALLNASVKTALGLLADGHEASTGGSAQAKADVIAQFLGTGA
ncbi:alpha/beta fold hydrolase [Novosphingobium guangzhouense]|uniref:Alpha/beta hydrolase n=1 Tax=Novosphingobium guangzhouense TaxID=1850347 RepID=A0A2K2G736_9SPHN|nr:alpha/beta hydrolase [Novosphingobium guangzhouense]PNU06844.1 alpha/beta hydrolase [Novosphingobium guangzhouense]